MPYALCSKALQRRLSVTPPNPPTRNVRHFHDWQRFHADYCHKYENGETCRICGETRSTETRPRDFRDVHSGWWGPCWLHPLRRTDATSRARPLCAR